VFGKASYVDVGRVYFSTEERSVKLRRADGGLVSWIWRKLIGQDMVCRKMCISFTSWNIEGMTGRDRKRLSRHAL